MDNQRDKRFHKTQNLGESRLENALEPLPNWNYQENHDDVTLTEFPGHSQMYRPIPRLLRSPPQPHMCIQVTLKGTDTPCFINVLAWHKVCGTTDPKAPIPLYGGVKVPLNDRSSVPSYIGNRPDKPLVFAVVVSPRILQEKGKNATNLKEQAVLVDLILDFVEAMNNDVELSRTFTVLKDRDLTGELKDMWTKIHEKRDSEKGCHTTHQDVEMMDENCLPSLPPDRSHYIYPPTSDLLTSNNVGGEQETQTLVIDGEDGPLLVDNGASGDN